jgi:hypothetical protein
MEEEEEVLVRIRSKLYVFIKEDVYGGETRKNWWKERGSGDVKILKHKTTGATRLLMRQNQTLKICANHLLDPTTTLVPQAGSDGKAFTFTAADFADGSIKKDLFALRFSSQELAQTFKQAYDTNKSANSKILKTVGSVAAKVEAPAAPPSAVDSLAKDVAKVNVNTAVKTSPSHLPVKPNSPVVLPLLSSQPPPATLLPPAATSASSSQQQQQHAMVGAYSKKELDDAGVVEAAKFACGAISKGELVKIASARAQVVAGINYKLALHLRYPDGSIHAHVATVYVPLPHTKQPPKLTEEVHTGVL